jgi:molybdenum cofactor cytidylyltransferase
MIKGSGFGVVILAAGASSRMGQPKMLLPWGETTVIGRLLEQWREIPATQIAVMCAAGDLAIAAELDRLGFAPEARIINSDPARGMFSSIQAAAQWQGWNPALGHVAIALGDQPHLNGATLRSLAEFACVHPHDICQPAYGTRGKHPVFLPLNLFRSLASTTAGTLRDFLVARASDVCQLESNDSGLAMDLDTPADYEQAQRQFLSKGQGSVAG